MASYQKCEDYIEEVNKASHAWNSHTFKAALSNTAPNLATMTVLADITQIGSSGGYSGGVGGGVALDGVTLSRSGGTAKLVVTDEVITAVGGNIGPFRYVWIYNDSAAGDPLVGVYDYGAAITLLDGESLSLDFDAANGLWQMA